MRCPQGAKAHSSENREALNEITPMIEGLWRHTAGCFASPGFIPPLSSFPRTVPWGPTARSGRGRGDVGKHQVNFPEGDRESQGPWLAWDFSRAEVSASALSPMVLKYPFIVVPTTRVWVSVFPTEAPKDRDLVWFVHGPAYHGDRAGGTQMYAEETRATEMELEKEIEGGGDELRAGRTGQPSWF